MMSYYLLVLYAPPDLKVLDLNTQIMSSEDYKL